MIATVCLEHLTTKDLIVDVHPRIVPRMGRPISNRPTDAEFEILVCLWERGIATIRDVHDHLLLKRKVAYTSVATIMRIMLAKGMVELTDERRPQKFRAVITEVDARKLVADEWLERLFAGSVTDLVRHALAGRRCSSKEITEMREAIEQAKSNSRISTPAPSMASRRRR